MDGDLNGGLFGPSPTIRTFLNDRVKTRLYPSDGFPQIKCGIPEKIIKRPDL